MKSFFIDRIQKLSAFFKTEHLVSFLLSVHIILLFVFLYSRTYFMVAVNLGSLLLYACCYSKRILKNYPLLVSISFAEILIHMILATFCVGWDSGFYLYVLAMIPIIYYLSYVASHLFHQKISASIYSLISVAVFLILRLVSYQGMPIDQTVSPSVIHSLYFANACITLTLALTSMSLFYSTIRNTEEALRLQNQKLNSLASIDSLTGFYNRRSMNEFLAKAMLHASKPNNEFCIVLGDIDNFKQINDTHGHECGDLVLKKIAQIMQKDVCQTDYICRWGGEEILILLQNCKYEDAIILAEKIRTDIAASSFLYNGEVIHFSMTFGIHKYETEYQPSEIIKKADCKLYRGKRNGKNCVVS